MEDEPSVRSITVKILQQLGYVTLATASGAEALEMSRTYRGTIALLLTDVVMPNMNGRQLARELAGARPDMKVLYLSGYTGNVALQHGIVDSSVAFLPKPFSATRWRRRYATFWRSNEVARIPHCVRALTNS